MFVIILSSMFLFEKLVVDTVVNCLAERTGSV